MNCNVRSLLISPWITSRLSIAIMIFQPVESPRVIVFAFGVIALEDGGCAALEGFGGFGCEGTVSRIVGDDGRKWSYGWEALSLSLGQRYAGIRVLYELDATYGTANADNGLHRRPDHDPDEVPWRFDVS